MVAVDHGIDTALLADALLERLETMSVTGGLVLVVCRRRHRRRRIGEVGPRRGGDENDLARDAMVGGRCGEDQQHKGQLWGCFSILWEERGGRRRGRERGREALLFYGFPRCSIFLESNASRETMPVSVLLLSHVFSTWQITTKFLLGNQV